MPAGPVDPLPHLMARIVKLDSECWVWTQYVNLHGYGVARLTALGGHVLVHRAVYELTVGPIPQGLELDHLCRNPPCCNPAHLEPVTHAVNVERSTRLERLREAIAERVRCRNGHAYTKENLHIRPDGRRRCRTCANASARRARAAA